MAKKPTDWTGLTLSDGRYRFESKLGEGGMGIVYRAHDTRLGMDVVIKVPRRAMLDDPAFADRFAREIRSLVRLSHPNIVKVTDVGVYEGLPFAVMQYLPGGSLEDRRSGSVAADGASPALDARSVAGWITGVAAALDYVHSKGYVHRDVKPGNILFDAQGHAFLGDFGVIKALASSEKAQAAERSATAAGLVLGTPEYMAPELIMGEEVDGRVDQYALAVTLYEVLCGRRPFEGSTPTAVLVLHTTKPPAALSELRPSIPGRLSQAVLRGLAKEPSGRYPSCAAFAAAVVAALEPSPASSESVRVQCPSCGKAIALAPSAFANLKRTGRSFPCPACQAPVEVSGEGTRISRTPQTIVERNLAPGGTQKIATTGPGAATQKVAAQGPVAATQKVAAQGPVAATQKVATTGRAEGQRAATMKLDALNPVGPGKTRPSLVPWIAGAAAAVLAVASVVFLRSGGPAAKTAPALVASTRPADGGEDRRVPRDSSPDLRPPQELSPAPGPVARPTPAPSPTNPAPAGPEPGLSTSPTLATTAPPSGSREAELLPAAKPEPETVAMSPVPGIASNPGDARESAAAPEERTQRPDARTPATAPGEGAGASSRKAKVSLESLLKTPEMYADQEVIPGGLYLLGPGAIFQPDGRVSVPAIEGHMSVSSKGMIGPVSSGAATTLDVDPGLAQGLISKNLLHHGNFPGAPTLRCVAILTVRVIKDVARYSAKGWLLHLVRAEFLVNLNPQRISELKFAHAFQTFTIGGGAEFVGVGNPDEWKPRLGQHFLVQTGKAFKLFKNQMLAARQAAMNSIIGGMVSRAEASAEQQEVNRQRDIQRTFRVK
jgi:serine/threonine-protein kinase